VSEPRGASAHLHAARGEAEEYLDLVAAVEATAAELKTPVRIEGLYAAPRSRLNVLISYARFRGN